MIEHPLKVIARQFGAYNAADALAKTAALLLMPDNAQRTARLELAVCAAAAANGHRNTPIPVNALRSIVNGPELSDPQLVMQEDPFDGWFVEALTFVAGSYQVLPGISSGSTFVLRHLAKAVTLSKQAFSEAAFAGHAERLLLAGLTLSDEVVRRAGLHRGIPPIDRTRDTSILVPKAERIDMLSKAVRFRESEVESILQGRGVDLTSLEPLVVRPAEIDLEKCDPQTYPLQARPIVRVSGELIVACPSLITAALRHQVFCMAKSLGVLDELVSRINAATWSTVLERLRDLHYEHQAGPYPGDRPGLLMLDGLFSFDTDKALYTCLVTDDLKDYDESTVFGHRSEPEVGPLIKTHFDHVANYLARLPAPPNDLLCCFLMNGLGRSWGCGVPESANPPLYELLMMSASDLETISIIERGDPLQLWRFAKASRQLRERSKVMAIGTLNEYGCWRQHDYSFYLSDKAAPSGVFFACDWEACLYREALSQADTHGVLSYDSQHIAEVTAFHGTHDIPVYGKPPTLDDRIALVVEGYAIPIWVVGPTSSELPYPANYPALVQVADMITYWLWQLCPSLRSWFNRAFGSAHRVFVISVHADERLENIADRSSTAHAPSAFDVETRSSGVQVSVTFHAAVNELLGGPSNDGEKALMRHLLMSIRDTAPDDCRQALPLEQVTQIIDKHAGAPLKKKLIVTDINSDPSLDPRGLPSHRLIPPSETNELLDELGHFLKSVKGLPTGPIKDEARTAVLNSAVEYCFTQMKLLVRSLSVDGLLEWLVTHHEAVLRATAFRKLTLPTQLACFGDQQSLCEKWTTERSNLSGRALALRFIIEYVVACPPSGIRPMSLSVHDRLLALASEIIQVGFQSDIIHFNLSEVGLEMLPSGRLGRNLDAFDAAGKAYMTAFSEADVASAPARFVRRWSRDSGERPKNVDQIDDAALAEFGYTLTELGTCWAEAGALAMEQSPRGYRIPLIQLVETFAKRLSWAQDKVRGLIEAYSLRRRSDFLSPPAPFARSDVYPWCFTRRYSYIRRPFLLVESQKGVDVLLAHRHLHFAWKYLLHLCFDGRLVAEQQRMKSLVSKLNSEAAEAFNDKVADALEKLPPLKVRRRVKKAGKLKGALGPPGDIDVLVADPRTRTLFLIECKDLALARTPREMAQQLDSLFKGTGQDRSTVEKHLKRAQWARDNVAEVLAWLGLGYSAKWRITPLIVLDHRPMVAYLNASPMEVIALDTLLERFAPRR